MRPLILIFALLLLVWFALFYVVAESSFRRGMRYQRDAETADFMASFLR